MRVTSIKYFGKFGRKHFVRNLCPTVAQRVNFMLKCFIERVQIVYKTFLKIQYLQN